MKKIFIFLLFIIITANSNAQNYFERQIDKKSRLDALAMLSIGMHKFDYSKFNSMTLSISEYNTTSNYHKYISNTGFSQMPSLADKKEYHTKIWKEAMEESSLSAMTYAFTDKEFNELSDKEKVNSLFFAFHKNNGKSYSSLWYYNGKNQSFPLMIIEMEGLDPGDKGDLIQLLNTFHQSITKDKDKMIEKFSAEALGIMRNDKDVNEGNFNDIRTESYATSQVEMVAGLTQSFIAKGPSLTLMIPKESKSDKLDKVLKTWNYTKYDYFSQAEIDNKIQQGDSSYCYMDINTMGPKIMRSTLISIASAYDQEPLYMVTQLVKAKDELDKVMALAKEDLDKNKVVYHPDNTIIQNKVDFLFNYLPKDLNKNKLAYVKISKEEMEIANSLNGEFISGMKKYPYSYEIFDDVESIKNCKYRVRFKMFPEYNDFTNISPSHTRPNQMETSTYTQVKYLFYLYIENIETGETYTAPVEPEILKKTMKNFIEEVNKG